MASVEVMRHNRTVLASLEEGDLLEFKREGAMYSHWAVYIGNEKVIHLTTDDDKKALNPEHACSCCGRCSDKARVRIGNFFIVADKRKAKRNNSLDRKKNPLAGSQVVKNALSRLNEVGYNIISKNCEHFATWCRYGEASSDQVDFWVNVGLLGAAVAVIVAVVVIAVFVNHSRKSKKETQ